MASDLMFLFLQIAYEYASFLILARLFISQSMVTGTIPTVIGELTKLVQLNFAQQDLTGTIPTELLSLSNLGKSRAYKRARTLTREDSLLSHGLSFFQIRSWCLRMN
jgi:hypothetical protein